MSGVFLDHLWQWAGLLLLLCGSAVFSGSETALFSLSGHELYQFGSSSNSLRRLAARLMRHPRRVLLTLLIGNTLINILIFAISYVLFSQVAGRHSALWVSLGSVGTLLAVIIFGEVLPKAMALAGARRLAPVCAVWVGAAQQLFAPVRLLLSGLVVEPLTRLLAPSGGESAVITTQELRLLVEGSQRLGVIDADESGLLQQVLELRQVKVRQVMVPRVDVKAFDIAAEPDLLRRFMRQHRLKKVPVFEGNIDHIVGLVYAKRLFVERQSTLRELIRPVRFVPEQMRLDQLLEHFRQSSTQLAIVVDEFGGTAGLVSLEDVLEQIVGEIEGPGSVSEPPVQQLDDRSFLVAGGLSVHEWPAVFGGRLVDRRATTIAGLVLARLGRVPQVGETLLIGNVRLTVVKMQGRRIDRLRLELVGPDTAGEGSAK